MDKRPLTGLCAAVVCGDDHVRAAGDSRRRGDQPWTRTTTRLVSVGVEQCSLLMNVSQCRGPSHNEGFELFQVFSRWK